MYNILRRLCEKVIRCLKFFARMIDQRTERQAMRYAFYMRGCYLGCPFQYIN